MNVLIIGCGRVGAELARTLSADGHNITVLDKNEPAFRRLGDGFNGTTLVGNGIDIENVRQAGVEKADIAVVTTNGDNTNLMAAQICKKIFNISKVITRVYDPVRAEIFRQNDLDIISGTTVVSAMRRRRVAEEE